MVRATRWSTLIFGLLASGCLVTADPVTYEPTQSPPMIVASGLNPDPRGILRVGGDEGLSEFAITASILSEDNGESVKVALYVDYGVLNGLSQPFSAIVQAWPDVAAGTLAEGPRPLVGIRWVDGIAGIAPGCHRLTLMATHAFDATTRCPSDLNDSSQITWHFRQCEDGECPASLVDCPPIDATCPLAP